MIVAEAKRLQEEGKEGLVLLPGVNELLGEVSRDARRSTSTKVSSCSDPSNRSGPSSRRVCRSQYEIELLLISSATSTYASAALPTAGVPQPPVFITAEAVKRGKPYPDPYLLGAKGLDLSAEQCVVFEDAPSGVRSGVASGARVLAVCTSHQRKELEGLGAHWIVQDLSK